jgi:hypothetical protein
LFFSISKIKTHKMKKRLLGLALVMLVGFSFTAKADEGMWLPMFIKRLNYADMKKHGLKLTAEELYSVNQSSLKDAIVSLGGFCTAEIISPNGLMLTNHHCGFEAIQSHSSVEHDYLTDGFWAKDHASELPNEGLTASFLVRMADVSKQINDSLVGLSEAERGAKIQAMSKAIVAEATEGTLYNANVKAFFEGNEFYLFVYETFQDVRLVGAPPSSIGKYGGDTDNWMWPRHTGDFSIFRVYTAPDGTPAPYSEANVPLKPKHFLPISMEGVKEGDFSMIFGYPGSTDRYLTSFGVEDELQNHQPTVVSIRDKKLAIMREFMNEDPAVRIQYASKYAQVANYWKYYIGQQEQLKNNNVWDQKVALENDFEKWVNGSEVHKAKYGEALALIRESVTSTSKTTKANTYLLEAGLTGSDAILYAFRSNRALMGALKSGDAEKIKAATDKLMAGVDAHFGDYNPAMDQKMYVEMMKMFYENVNKAQLPDFFEGAVKSTWGSVERYANRSFKNSIFVDKNKMKDFLANPSQKVLDRDPILKASSSMINMYFGQSAANAEAFEKFDKGNRLFVAGLREMNASKNYYPNANSTMRMTYGNVGSYQAKDAITYDFGTTMKGLIAKKDNSNPEFVVPEKLVELYNNKDYGRYANADGTMSVCFISNNDITGGNSGSPVINGKGELIGLAFDGNWEAMSGDIAFEPTLQRTISVDIRYVLFIVDKFAGASHLVDEMMLVGEKSNMASGNKKKKMSNVH